MFEISKHESDQRRLNQILGNWGQFEPVTTQPAGAGATVDFRFRNGKKVSFVAKEINVAKLLADVKNYIKAGPKQMEWNQVNISNLGYRLVQENQLQYVGDKVAGWDMELAPRDHHFDRRVTVNTPLNKAGAYLLTGAMDNGNVSNIILWVADTAIVKKPLAKQTYCYVADAVTGAPIAGATLDFFGYSQQWVNDQDGRGHQQISTKTLAATTDANGQAITDLSDNNRGYQWLITATTANGRLAYLGYTGAWYNDNYDQEYNQTKTFAITDRPVYRPGNAVKFKFWVNQAKYDQDGKSPYAGAKFTVRATNPKGEKVFEKELTADDFGGFDGEFPLEKDAMLGSYYISLPNPPEPVEVPVGTATAPVAGKAAMGRGVAAPTISQSDDVIALPRFVKNNIGGGIGFRVEEYKKPEFEVTVQAPKEPVMLGEKITATIQAKYYFGAPVTNAKVKYKVLRSSHSANWYPAGNWDWYYGTGYWWYACDYAWYPGWRDWGCRRPMPIWGGYHGQAQPEVVSEDEVTIGEDGAVKVEIDTAIAKELFGDTDHRYQITAEVVDQSRRTIVGQGAVLVARKPFKVYAWVDRGHYRVGDVVQADFSAQTLDSTPVKGQGSLRLLKVTYANDVNGSLKPVENEVERWNLATDDQGKAHLQIKAALSGEYRLSYTVADANGHSIEGGYLFTVMGDGYDGSGYRFNDIELIADDREYQPGDKLNLLVNTNRANSTVLLFVRPTNGVYLPPKVVRLRGQSVVEAIEVIKKDMPNFFVEAVTVSGGKVYSETREVVVPPEKRVLNVDVTPSEDKYKPGAKGTLKVTLTDYDGKPFQGSTVVSIYDKSVEYISGGSNVPAIKDFFWKWRRSHYPQTESSLSRGGGNLIRRNEIGMGYLGAFGASVANEEDRADQGIERIAYSSDANEVADGMVMKSAPGMAMSSVAAAPPSPGMAPMTLSTEAKDSFAGMGSLGGGGGAGGGDVEPTVRSNFADTALWVGALTTDANGEATIPVTMPESLTAWKARVWAMGDGTRVGEGTAEVVTAKDLMVRLQAPRFFTQKDEVVISANVHNYLKTAKNVRVVLELEGGTLNSASARSTGATSVETITLNQGVQVGSNSDQRVDWRLRVLQPGTAMIRVKAITDEESDAMEMTFPVYVHGMLKTDSFSGVLRPDVQRGSVKFRVPAERRPEQSRLEVRYSPTLAGAMVDALPYLSDYPYDFTESTLNRFIPTVITQKVLLNMGVSLQQIRDKRTNLNAQEIGDDKTRAQDWKRMGKFGTEERNPVYDEKEVDTRVKYGLNRLASMQCSDGGWGWLSGWGEQSYPHTTALVVHGMYLARNNGVTVDQNMFARGVQWLQNYQAEQIRRLKLPELDRYHKRAADNLDAFVYMVLVDQKIDNTEMRDFLYRDRIGLAVYAKAMFGLALHKVGDMAKRDMLIQNIDQFLVQDDENQTTYLKLPNDGWWYWYGSEYEAQAYYLKLLTVTDPKGEKAPRLVKYLLNNRKHATYWNSTRDTAIVIEAFADYLRASGEDKPNMTVQVKLDGKVMKTVQITPDTLFSFDNKLVLEGAAVTTGEHTLELVKTGNGPLYFNAYLTNFTLEDPIGKAGLEIKVNRQFFKLVPVAKTIKVEGSRGQALDQRVEKYQRVLLKDLSTVKSGDLLEVELTIDSKNDYEYILFEDMKAAGCEPVEVRSGYSANDMGAYMELRDERVAFFVRSLARGKHSLSYRLRAEIPGQFSAMPTKASAVYAPELKANSDEMKLKIED
ncbi:MAG: alpha-2-macroglobulin family protein [Armatimonadota bacterium]